MRPAASGAILKVLLSVQKRNVKFFTYPQLFGTMFGEEEK
jgi:hypothetical protein